MADDDNTTIDIGAEEEVVEQPTDGYLKLPIGSIRALPGGRRIKIDSVIVAGNPVLRGAPGVLRPGDEIAIISEQGGLGVFESAAFLVKGNLVNIADNSFKDPQGVRLTFNMPTETKDSFGEGNAVRLVLIGPDFQAEIDKQFIFLESTKQEEEAKAAKKKAEEAQKRAEDFQSEGSTNVGDFAAKVIGQAATGTIAGVTGNVLDTPFGKQISDAVKNNDPAKLAILARQAQAKGDLNSLKAALSLATNAQLKNMLQRTIMTTQKELRVKAQNSRTDVKTTISSGQTRSSQITGQITQSELDNYDDEDAQAPLEGEVEVSTKANFNANATISSGGTTQVGGATVSVGGTNSGGAGGVSVSSTTQTVEQGVTIAGSTVGTGAQGNIAATIQGQAGQQAQAEANKSVAAQGQTKVQAEAQGGQTAPAAPSVSGQQQVSGAGTPGKANVSAQASGAPATGQTAGGSAQVSAGSTQAMPSPTFSGGATFGGGFGTSGITGIGGGLPVAPNQNVGGQIPLAKPEEQNEESPQNPEEKLQEGLEGSPNEPLETPETQAPADLEEPANPEQGIVSEAQPEQAEADDKQNTKVAFPLRVPGQGESLVPKNLEQAQAATAAILQAAPEIGKKIPALSKFRDMDLSSGKPAQLLNKGGQLANELTNLTGSPQAINAANRLNEFANPKKPRQPGEDKEKEEFGTENEEELEGSQEDVNWVRNARQVQKIASIAEEIARLTGREDIANIIDQLNKEGLGDLSGADAGAIRRIASNLAGKFASNVAQGFGGLSKGKSSAIGGAVAGFFQGEGIIGMGIYALAWFVLDFVFGVLLTPFFLLALLFLNFYNLMSKLKFRLFPPMSWTQKQLLRIANFSLIFVVAALTVLFAYFGCNYPIPKNPVTGYSGSIVGKILPSTCEIFDKIGGTSGNSFTGSANSTAASNVAVPGQSGLNPR